MDKTKEKLKIDYSVEFNAIYNQISKSQEWDKKADIILKLPRDQQFKRLSDVKFYLKEILDDDESGELEYALVTQ